MNYELQIKKYKNRLKNRKKHCVKKGFTLLETLVAIVIFGIISVVMSSIVLNLVSFSVFTDRRIDFLNELSTAVGNIKNELRNAEFIDSCSVGPNPGINRSLFISKKVGTYEAGKQFMQLSVDSDSNRLVWNTLATNPASQGNLCTLSSTPSTEFLVSNSIDIDTLTINRTSDGDNKNSLIYVSFNACDDPAVINKVFDCTESVKPRDPYRYMFAISTRNF